MSKFDDFNARVERTKAEADRESARAGRYRGGYSDPRRSGFGSTFASVLADFFGAFIAEILVRVWWFFLLAGAGVGVISFGMGVSLSTAFMIAVALAIGVMVLMAFLSGDFF